jgi:phosphoribosyl 1,2-cyclic phosphodiesterase
MSDFTVTFWGTRGSMPVSGERFREFGGNTTCLEIRAGEHHVIVDCGSGALGLGQALIAGGQRSATLLLTHFHLDHVIGLTGFAPLFADGFAVAIRAAHRRDISLGRSLSLLFQEPLSPVGFASLPAMVDVATFETGHVLDLGSLAIRTVALRHGQGTAGFRFDHGGRAFVVLTDHEHEAGAPDPSLVTFCAGADAVAYDAMWCADSDYEAHRGWGHSTWQAGLDLLQAASAGRLICMHHAPTADDALLRGREARLQVAAPGSLFARDGHVHAL